MSDYSALHSILDQPIPPKPRDTETFCDYLAKQYIAKKGYVVATAPELQKLVAICDHVLTYSDGLQFDVICLIDRESYPAKTFNITPTELQDSGQSCLKYAGKIRRNQMPVTFKIIEIGRPTADQTDRLSSFKRKSFFAKVIPTTFTVDPQTHQLWTSTRFYGTGSTTKFIQGLLTKPRETNLDLTPRPIVTIARQSFPWVTSGILLLLAAIFAGEVRYGGWEPSPAALAVLGGSSYSLVVQNGQWFRLLSAPFLHANLLHLVLNGIVLGFAGYRLEHVLGRSWFIAVYVIGAICGTLLSVLWNDPLVISVGGSGAITGLFAAMLVTSFHFAGADRLRLQTSSLYVLLQAVAQPFRDNHGVLVDYADHLGGALGGAATALLVLRLWPAQKEHPRLGALAWAMISVLLVAPLEVSVVAQWRLSGGTFQRLAVQTGASSANTRGNSYLNQHNYDQAIIQYNLAMQLDPKNPTYVYNRGLAYLGKPDNDRAIADFNAAIGLNPGYAIAFLNRGIAYQRKRDYTRAIADYTKVLELDPKSSLAHNNIGFAYYSQGNNTKAIIEYNAAIQLDPRSDLALTNRGLARRRSGDLNSAIADYSAAIRLNPNNFGAHFSRGSAYIDKADYADAIADDSEAIRIRPNDAPAFNNRCWARALAGQMEQALSDCNDALRLQPKSAEAFDSRGFVRLKSGKSDSDFRSAIADYDAAVAILPKASASLYGRGLAKRMIGDASSETDIAAAQSIKSDIAHDFANYGLPSEVLNRRP